MNRIAVAILSFKRYNYLKRCLESLERNEDLDGVDFYLYQDGAVNLYSGKRYAQDGEIEWSVKVFADSQLPNKQVVRREYNLCTVGNICQIFPDLFSKGYEFVVWLPGDMISGKYYIKSLLTISEQFKDDPYAGILSTGPIGTRAEMLALGPAESKSVENKVAYGHATQCDMGVWRKCWEQAGSVMIELWEKTRNYDFRDISACIPAGYPNLPLQLIHLQGICDDLVGKFRTVHPDCILQIRASELGFYGLHTIAPRVTEIGVYSAFRPERTPEEYGQSYGLDKILLHDIGDVDKYELSGAHPMDQLWIPVQFIGRTGYPFSTTGQATHFFYYGIVPDTPFKVHPSDLDSMLSDSHFRLA